MANEQIVEFCHNPEVHPEHEYTFKAAMDRGDPPRYCPGSNIVLKKIHEHDGSGCTSCHCVAVPWAMASCICPDQDPHDPVNHPKHYISHPSGIECIEITRHMGFNLGNTVKYIWRDGLKDSEVPLQDLKKALWYLQDEIMMREERDKHD